MSLKNFKEEYLFAKYKDKCIYSAAKFKGEIKDYKNINASDLYVRIINYQIKKYGRPLSGTGNRPMYIPLENINNNSSKRKQSRNSTRGIYKNAKLKRWTDENK